MRGPGYNFLTCGCPSCIDALNRSFAAIVLDQIPVGEEYEMEARAGLPPMTVDARARVQAEAMARRDK